MHAQQSIQVYSLIIFLTLLGPHVLAPIRTVQDTVAKSAKYSMDPFCPSYIDFQSRAEDELAKFLYIIVNKASEMPLDFDYYIYVRTGGYFESTSHFNKALESGSVFDLRWQLKHFCFKKNTDIYCNYVFQPSWISPKPDYFTHLLQYIKQKANNLAHKKHLNDQMQTVGANKWRHYLCEEMVTAGRLILLISSASLL